MAGEAWRLDPITCTELEDPYLASDGITYSKTSIETAMAMDEWHRSPVTGEVLRPLCYKNVVIAQLLVNSNRRVKDTAHAPLLLYDCSALPDNGGSIAWTFPKLCTAQMAAFKMKWKLDADEVSVDDAITITVRVLTDAGGLLWLMHPPAAEEMWDDCIDVAKLLNMHKMVANPWCLTTAVLRVGDVCTTVESQWMKAHS